MIVTHTQNANGQRRIYLGGKSSLECWIEPKDRYGWTFHFEEAVAGNHLSAEDKRDWAIHTLLSLATELNVAPQDLSAVPFERIAALHSADPFSGRRIATGRRKAIENGYLATVPGITRPQADFTADNYPNHRRQRA